MGSLSILCAFMFAGGFIIGYNESKVVHEQIEDKKNEFKEESMFGLKIKIKARN
jgi:hypothetical protein